MLHRVQRQGPSHRALVVMLFPSSPPRLPSTQPDHRHRKQALNGFNVTPDSEAMQEPSSAKHAKGRRANATMRRRLCARARGARQVRCNGELSPRGRHTAYATS